MRAWILVPALALILQFSACSGDGSVELPDQPPKDFTVVYEWREGSLPPPYHVEYTVTIGGDGTGSVVMIPDYEFNSPPRWTETFALDAEAIARLYTSLKDGGLASTSWKESSDPPVGGGSGSLTVTVSGEAFEVPAFVVSSQQQRRQALADAVGSAVPELVWGKLESKRQEYIAAHSK